MADKNMLYSDSVDDSTLSLSGRTTKLRMSHPLFVRPKCFGFFSNSKHEHKINKFLWKIVKVMINSRPKSGRKNGIPFLSQRDKDA